MDISPCSEQNATDPKKTQSEPQQKAQAQESTGTLAPKYSKVKTIPHEKVDALCAWHFGSDRGCHFAARDAEDDVEFQQYKGIEREEKEDPLEEADRLNGIVWKGTLFFSASASRIWRSKAAPLDGLKAGWSEWRSVRGAGSIMIFHCVQKSTRAGW